jgi:hypothetical protein
MPITGGCLCGAIRYACDAEPLGAYLCHCTDCQPQPWVSRVRARCA